MSFTKGGLSTSNKRPVVSRECDSVLGRESHRVRATPLHISARVMLARNTWNMIVCEPTPLSPPRRGGARLQTPFAGSPPGRGAGVGSAS